MRAPTGRLAACLVFLVASATIAGALASQHVFGLVPCKLCLLQRWPYYVGVPLAALTMVPPSGSTASRTGLLLLSLVFLASIGLGAYHAGVEWGWFLGPSDCGGGFGAAPSGVGDFMRSLDGIRVVSCTEAAWRFLGLSLAGWNTLVSLGLAGLAGSAAWAGR